MLLSPAPQDLLRSPSPVAPPAAGAASPGPLRVPGQVHIHGMDVAFPPPLDVPAPAAAFGARLPGAPAAMPAGVPGVDPSANGPDGPDFGAGAWGAGLAADGGDLAGVDFKALLSASQDDRFWDELLTPAVDD